MFLLFLLLLFPIVMTRRTSEWKREGWNWSLSSLCLFVYSFCLSLCFRWDARDCSPLFRWQTILFCDGKDEWNSRWVLTVSMQLCSTQCSLLKHLKCLKSIFFFGLKGRPIGFFLKQCKNVCFYLLTSWADFRPILVAQKNCFNCFKMHFFRRFCCNLLNRTSVYLLNDWKRIFVLFFHLKQLLLKWEGRPMNNFRDFILFTKTVYFRCK